MVSNWTPCDSSVTVSFSGHWVASSRRRRSASASSEAWNWKGRTAVGFSLAAATSLALAGIAAVARASEATAVRAVKFRREGTLGASAIGFLVFMFLFVYLKDSSLQIVS